MTEDTMNNVVVFSTLQSAYLARKISDNLGICSQGSIERKTFGGIERYYRIGISDREELAGKKAVFVGSTHNDEDFLEIARVGWKLHNLGTSNRIFSIPFFGYSTMEREILPGEVETAKANALILSGIPGAVNNRFQMCDLHAAGIAHYFEGDCTARELHLGAQLVNAMAELDMVDGGTVIGSADLGRTLWVEYFAKAFKKSMAFVRKSREFEVTRVIEVIGDVRGKRVIIYDDMTRSSGTLIKAALAYLERGAAEVSVVLSHLAFNNGQAILDILSSPIRMVLGTNSHPMSMHPLISAHPDRFRVVDISGVLAKGILPYIQ